MRATPRWNRHRRPIHRRPDKAGAEPSGGLGDAEGHPAGGSGSTATETVTEYDQGAYGHRVTRRTVRRRETTEHVVETVTEDIPVAAYQAPESVAHPAPVG